ncbi:unnamed protein product [Colias eurytheme]|nr:unnamed protein product [Colias eurytheme]
MQRANITECHSNHSSKFSRRAAEAALSGRVLPAPPPPRRVPPRSPARPAAAGALAAAPAPAVRIPPSSR